MAGRGLKPSKNRQRGRGKKEYGGIWGKTYKKCRHAASAFSSSPDKMWSVFGGMMGSISKKYDFLSKKYLPKIKF